MAHGPKRPKNVGMLRYVLASNVSSLLPIVYSSIEDRTAREKALARAANVSASTVQRICAGSVGASIDNVEFIARALGTTVTELLTPSDATKRALNIKQ
jgi:transcriptional regulator with XRE-family HTH domain